MLRRLLILITTICIAGAAWAGEEGKKAAKPEPGSSIDWRLVAPMSQDGNLLGFTYISGKVICSSPSACLPVSDKFAFIQDAFLRDAYAAPIGLASDPKEVDKDRLSVRFTAAARRIVGEAKVRGVLILDARFSPLHPSDSTQMAPPQDKSGGQAASGTTPGGSEKPADAAKTGNPQGATSKPVSGSSH